MIGITNLSKSFGEQRLFEGVTLQLNAGCRYGLVGANGSGKTTFLNILAGDEPESFGEVAYPRGARIGVLRQDTFLNDEQLILDVAMMGDAVAWRALKEQDELAELEAPDAQRIAEVDEILNAHDGYTLETRATQVLVGLGIDERAHRRPLSTLSGGYKLRVLLAQVLVSQPEVLLLDEPTNHLDILSIRWLERFLETFKGCAVVISHDHRFLDNVATHILDVDYETITAYPGNYAAFGRQKAATRARQEIELSKAEKAIAEKKAFVDRFKAKSSKARQAHSRVKQIERIEIQTPPRSSRRYPKFRFALTRPSGRTALEIEGVSKAFGEHRVLEGASVTVRRAERVAVIGANGLGKSTLLKIATGNLAADAGRVAWGHETHVGYFAQDHKEQLPRPKQTVLEYLWEICPQEGTSFVRGVLGRVLFSGSDVDKKIESLSGGEETRLIFSRLMVQKPNVLILDEPTNHLDLEAIEALVQALEGYEGTLVFVSHDRWFVSKLANRIIEVRADGLTDFNGTYDEYLEQQGCDHLDGQQVELRAKQGRKATKRRGHAAARQSDSRLRRLAQQRDQLMERIEAVEARVAAIQRGYCEPGFFERTPSAEVDRLQAEERELGREQERLMNDWETVETALSDAKSVVG